MKDVFYYEDIFEEKSYIDVGKNEIMRGKKFI